MLVSLGLTLDSTGTTTGFDVLGSGDRPGLQALLFAALSVVLGD